MIISSFPEWFSTNGIRPNTGTRSEISDSRIDVPAAMITVCPISISALILVLFLNVDNTDDSHISSIDPSAPAGVAINPTTGVFSWTPDSTQRPNEYILTIRVTDDGVPAMDDSETFIIRVKESNLELNLSLKKAGIMYHLIPPVGLIPRRLRRSNRFLSVSYPVRLRRGR